MLKRTLISIIILSFTAILFLPAVNVLEIRNRNYPMQHYYSTLAFKKGFTISYTHSVNKGRVHDYYRVCDKKWLELFQTDFVSYGAGIPEPEEIPGAVFLVNGNTYSIKDINRKLNKLVMAVGLIANHTIQFNNSAELPLKELFPPQTSIVLEVKKVNLVQYLLGKKI